MSPVSSSSSLTRQQRAQPSQRLSHSLEVSASSGFVRQNGRSGSGNGGRAELTGLNSLGNGSGSDQACPASCTGKQCWSRAHQAAYCGRFERAQGELLHLSETACDTCFRRRLGATAV